MSLYTFYSAANITLKNAETETLVFQAVSIGK